MEFLERELIPVENNTVSGTKIVMQTDKEMLSVQDVGNDAGDISYSVPDSDVVQCAGLNDCTGKLEILYRNSKFMHFIGVGDSDLGVCFEELKSLMGKRACFPGSHHAVWLLQFLLSSGLYDDHMYLKKKLSDNVFITYTVGFVNDRNRVIRVCMEPEKTDNGYIVHCGVFGDVHIYPDVYPSE